LLRLGAKTIRNRFHHLVPHIRYITERLSHLRLPLLERLERLELLQLLRLVGALSLNRHTK
jgi:hypothetical protein